MTTKQEMEAAMDCAFAAVYPKTWPEVADRLEALRQKASTIVRGRHKEGAPVTIRGVTYATIKEAAFQLNTTTQAIYYARRMGKLDVVGLE